MDKISGLLLNIYLAFKAMEAWESTFKQQNLVLLMCQWSSGSSQTSFVPIRLNFLTTKKLLSYAKQEQKKHVAHYQSAFGLHLKVATKTR